MLTRRYDPEIMDDLSINDERMDRALSELGLVNKFLGGRSVTREGLNAIQRRARTGSRLSVLDIGAGGADVFEGSDIPLAVTALDRHPRVCEYLRKHVLYPVVCGDALRLSLQDNSFDVVHASLFLHHFREDEIRQILLSSIRISRAGVVINDLRRSFFAYLGIWILTLFFSRSAMVRHDGPLSVLRSFSERELRQLLAECGIDRYALHRRWAFRWLLIIWK